MWKLRTRFLNGNVKKKLKYWLRFHIFGKDGRTALITASEAGRLDVVQALISHQASVNAKDQVPHFPAQSTCCVYLIRTQSYLT